MRKAFVAVVVIVVVVVAVVAVVVVVFVNSSPMFTAYSNLMCFFEILNRSGIATVNIF